MERTRPVRGLPVPTFFYGTAWKEDDTAALVRLAIEQGFRAIDTANQRRHYHEAGVGEALAALVAEGAITREALFLQTKFTDVRGQDHRLPYDPDAPLAAQVAQSFASSLEHLGTTFVDSYVLHGPSHARGLSADDRAVWRAMEALVEGGRVRLLGVSNVSREQLEALHAFATVKPAFVQNRCFARDGWDREVRAFCEANDVVYQGFSLLTANTRELSHPLIDAIATRTARTVPELVFAFAHAVGILPLTGTTRAEHMRLDLAAHDLVLDAKDVRTIRTIEAWM